MGNGLNATLDPARDRPKNALIWWWEKEKRSFLLADQLIGWLGSEEVASKSDFWNAKKILFFWRFSWWQLFTAIFHWYQTHSLCLPAAPVEFMNFSNPVSIPPCIAGAVWKGFRTLNGRFFPKDHWYFTIDRKRSFRRSRKIHGFLANRKKDQFPLISKLF